MAPRKYEQRVRAAAAADTRRRILDAAHQRLRATPTEPTSINDIASLAGVARPTVYQVFGSRGGLFDALITDILQRGGFDRLLDVSAHPDAREALRGAIRGVVGIYAGDRDVIRVLSAMALLNAAELGESVQRMEQRRAAGMSEVAQRLADQGILRREVTVEAATDLLYLLTSFDSFDLLYTGRQRSADDVARTLTDAAEHRLCG